jgi:mevalonate kinase
MVQIQVSAPGKVHLIGEHAVVYGKPAIIAAIGLRTYVKAKASREISYIDIAWPDIMHRWSVEKVFEIADRVKDLWNECNEKKNFIELFNFVKSNSYEGYRAAVLGIAMEMLGVEEGFSIEIDSKVPVGSGLGSSSSRAVAITAAIAKLFGKNLSIEKINEIAYEQEKIIHGTPSGGDNSACCYGGLIWFRKAQPKNEIRPLKAEIPHKLENFVIVNTGPSKTTGELVQLVRNLPEAYRNQRVREIGKMTKEMLDVLKRKDFEKMREIINKTQKNLAELGVSTPVIDKIAAAVRKINGAAKLCGAGGGGAVLCWHKDRNKLIKTIKNLGLQPIETELGVEGVRME